MAARVKSTGEVITPPVILGDIEYKYFQPCECAICHDHRPAHLHVWKPGLGNVCDLCQDSAAFIRSLFKK